MKGRRKIKGRKERKMGTVETWRRAYGALKDQTKLGLAHVNSDFKVPVLHILLILYTKVLGFINRWFFLFFFFKTKYRMWMWRLLRLPIMWNVHPKRDNSEVRHFFSSAFIYSGFNRLSSCCRISTVFHFQAGYMIHLKNSLLCCEN